MRSRSFIRLVVMAAILLLPVAAYAQEAAVSGTVTDGTGAVLPGVVIRAVHQASGNSFEAVQLRPDSTLVPRNNFVGKPIHRVDMRVQKRLTLGPRMRLDGVLEVFNLLDHANYGAYITEESNRNYGQPTQTPGLNCGPRMLQLGFRATF